MDEETRHSLEQINVLLGSNISLERASCNDYCNNYGYKFIELCKNNNFFLLLMADSERTCKDRSTVYYVIRNAFFFAIT